MFFCDLAHPMQLFRGHVGQLRFCLRMDCDPSSFGRCQVEELSGHVPHGSDVLVFIKKWMADPEPVRVICLVPARVCLELRNAFQQPVGNQNRRAIGEQVRQNIQTYAPQCCRQKSIHPDALAYLTQWVDGTLQKVPRPTSFAYLNLRRYGIQGLDAPRMGRTWSKPNRFRTIHCLPASRSECDGESEDDGAAGPLELED